MRGENKDVAGRGSTTAIIIIILQWYNKSTKPRILLLTNGILTVWMCGYFIQIDNAE